MNDLWFLWTPVVWTGGELEALAPLRRSVSPPRAESELRAPSAPLLLKSCAKGMAEARGLAEPDPVGAFPAVPAAEPDPPSRFAFWSSTLRERGRCEVDTGPVRSGWTGRSADLR